MGGLNASVWVWLTDFLCDLSLLSALPSAGNDQPMAFCLPHGRYYRYLFQSVVCVHRVKAFRQRRYRPFRSLAVVPVKWNPNDNLDNGVPPPLYLLSFLFKPDQLAMHKAAPRRNVLPQFGSGRKWTGHSRTPLMARFNIWQRD